MAGYTGTLSNLVDAFIAGAEVEQSKPNQFLQKSIPGVAGYYSPFLQHVLSYWKHRHEEHLLFLTYEEMKSDLAAVVTRVANFLGKTLTPKQVPTWMIM